MKYLLEEDVPTVECCGIQYVAIEEEEECFICGAAIDWDDVIGHWDENDPQEDGEEENENSPFYVGESRRSSRKDEEEDESSPFYVNEYSSKGNSRKLDTNEYYGSLFKGVPNSGRQDNWRDFDGWRNRKQEPKGDPFLDKEIPDGVL